MGSFGLVTDGRPRGTGSGPVTPGGLSSSGRRTICPVTGRRGKPGSQRSATIAAAWLPAAFGSGSTTTARRRLRNCNATSRRSRGAAGDAGRRPGMVRAAAPLDFLPRENRHPRSARLADGRRIAALDRARESGDQEASFFASIDLSVNLLSFNYRLTGGVCSRFGLLSRRASRRSWKLPARHREFRRTFHLRPAHSRFGEDHAQPGHC